MKKSQLHSQIFIYVLTIILVSFIFVYGYNAIRSFKDKTDEVGCIKLQTNLRNAIENILTDYGSLKRKDLQLCKDFVEICFVETYERISNRNNPTSNVPPINPFVKDSVLSETQNNVFLTSKSSIEAFYAGNISVDYDVFCLRSTNNKISLRLEGRGNHVLVSGLD